MSMPYGNPNNPIVAHRQGYAITRMDVIQWESAGAPWGPCPTCKSWVRTGLDRCCNVSKTTVVGLPGEVQL
jgi:hypothetical protein